MRFNEVKSNWKWLTEHIGDDEPCVLKFPRREAKRNIENKRKSKRIVVTTDEQTFKEFHALKEAWMLELHENPTFFYSAMMEALNTFDVRGWKEKQEAPSAEGSA